MIANLFNRFTYQYCKKQVWLRPAGAKKKKTELRNKQFSKFIHICVDFGVPFDVYMKSHFESWLLPYFLKKTTIGHIPFVSLISEKAVARFKEYETSVKEKFIGDQKDAEYYRIHALDVEKAVRNSAKKFYEFLCRIDGLTEDYAITALEHLKRSGAVSNVFVFACPLRSEELTKTADEVSKKLSEDDKKLIKRLRRVMRFERKEVAKYVI